MASVSFASLEEGEVLEIAFLKPQGGQVHLQLLVDCGFTGQSCFVLSKDAEELSQASAPASQVAGAIQGVQERAVVTYYVPGLSTQASEIAILADISALSLPPGVQGLAGLRFLRHFRRWGAEQDQNGVWHFILEDDVM
jgi:hypothetical protein